MSASVSILDDEGNINSAKLSKELKEALEFDIRYKQTDNMKKRAVRVATSYDEFKAMVACSHLKKLSKKEVESLAEVKKGWKKSSHINTEHNAASILDFEQQREQLQAKNSEVVSKLQNKKKPKSSMELERDLRRLSDDDKFRYLIDLGCQSTIKLMKKGLDVDGMEEILRVLITVGTKAVDATSVNLLEWLEQISQLEKFSLMIQFANSTLLEPVREYLSLQQTEVAERLLKVYGK